MTGVTNNERCEWAIGPLNMFSEQTFSQSFSAEVKAAQARNVDMSMTNGPDMIADLICNLLHVAAKNGIDPDTVIQNAVGSYEHERQLGWDEEE